MSKMDIDGSLPGLDANPRVCRCIPLGDVDNAVLLNALQLWESLKDGHRYPPRSAITPRILKPILRNTTLIKVIDGGTDYEFRIVGDAYVMAHGHSFQGMRWSEIGTLSPGFQKYIKPIYDRVVREGDPLALRGWIERGGTSTGHVFSEYLYMPLGGAEVDHILAVAVYLRRDGLDHATQSSFTI